MSDKASEFLRSGPGRLATGEGGAPRVGKSAFTPEAALANLSTVDDPRPQQPAEPPVARKLEDEINPSDQARADFEGQASSGPVGAVTEGGGTEAFAAPSTAADPAASPYLGGPSVGAAPSGAVQPAVQAPEPFAGMQEQINSLLEQVEVLRTALADAVILQRPGAIESGPVATFAASNAVGEDGPGLQAELASARPIDPAETGATDGGSGARSSLDAPDAGSVMVPSATGALLIGNAPTNLGTSALGETPLTSVDALIGAPSQLADDLAAAVTEPLVGAGEPALDLVPELPELAVEPLSGAVARLSGSPAGDAVAGTAEAQPLDAFEPIAEIASAPASAAVKPLGDVVEEAAKTVADVALASGGAPVAPLNETVGAAPTAVAELPPEAAEPPAEAPPSLESLLANVGAAIVVPGSVAESAAPKPPISEEPDEDGADFLAGTGLADDPADDEAPTGLLGGPLGGLNTPPPPDPLDF